MPDESNASLPLFFSKPQVISLEQHANARLRDDITMDFARLTNCVPLTVADIAEAAMHYPIVFSQDGSAAPLAVVGLEKENYFIDAQGKWLEGCYVPSYVRRYPFIFAGTPDSDKLTLMIDEGALNLDGGGNGPRLYEENLPSVFVNNALEFCSACHEQHQATALFSEALKRWDFLIPRVSNVRLANDREITLEGFSMIDIEKLQALPEKDILEGYRQGHLAGIYYVLQSQSNWRRLLELGNAREA
ncbi:MAG: SapC family protein [Alphaproteobacteria bacterium]|nr:SapC family protein [Alphaproteobacteria bacterium]